MDDLADRVFNQNFNQRDDTADELAKIVIHEEDNFIARCERSGLRVDLLHDPKIIKNEYIKAKRRFIVFVKEEQKVPAMKRLLEAYRKYSEYMLELAKERGLKKEAGQRRVQIPKWIDGSPITEKRPDYLVHKITRRINNSFSSAAVTLPEIIQFTKNEIKKEEKRLKRLRNLAKKIKLYMDSLPKKLSQSERDDALIRVFPLSKSTVEKLIDATEHYLDALNGALDLSHTLKSHVKRFPKDSFRIRRSTGIAVKITATYYNEKEEAISISKTTSNMLFVPVTDYYIYKEAFKRTKEAIYKPMIDMHDFFIYANSEKIEPYLFEKITNELERVSLLNTECPENTDGSVTNDRNAKVLTNKIQLLH